MSNETALRSPAERAEPCQVPRPGLPGEAERQCVHPFGHDVHWNGAGDVWLSDLAAAEARGYRKAIERLRAHCEWSRSEGLLASGAALDIAASYLEATEGDAR